MRMRTDAVGAGALAVVSATGSAASDTRIDATANSRKSDGLPSVSSIWPRVITDRLAMM